MAFLISSPQVSPKISFDLNPNSKSLKNFTILSSNSKIRSRTSVKLSAVREDVKSHGQFSAAVKPSQEEEEKQDYYVNTGYAIRTLREEFPQLFYRELTFDIYRFLFSSFDTVSRFKHNVPLFLARTIVK